MNRPLVYQLFCQGHSWVAMSGSDKSWKHLSTKPILRLIFIWDSCETSRLIGCRCKRGNTLSRAVLISRALRPLKDLIDLSESTVNDTCVFQFKINSFFCEQILMRFRYATSMPKDHKICRKQKGCNVLVLLPGGPHPFPSRTRKLSLLGPMVVRSGESRLAPGLCNPFLIPIICTQITWVHFCLQPTLTPSVSPLGRGRVHVTILWYGKEKMFRLHNY